MVTEPSIDEELVPKNEDENGNQEILMDQVFYNDANDHDALEKEKKEGEEIEEKEVKEEEKLMGKNYDENWNQEILMDQVLEWLTHPVVITLCNFALRLRERHTSVKCFP